MKRLCLQCGQVWACVHFGLAAGGCVTGAQARTPPPWGWAAWASLQAAAPVPCFCRAATHMGLRKILPSMQVAAEAASMLKRSRGRFLGDLQMDQQRLRADLEVLRGEVETFTGQGNISQVAHLFSCPCLPVCPGLSCQETCRTAWHVPEGMPAGVHVCAPAAV